MTKKGQTGKRKKGNSNGNLPRSRPPSQAPAATSSAPPPSSFATTPSFGRGRTLVTGRLTLRGMTTAAVAEAEPVVPDQEPEAFPDEISGPRLTGPALLEAAAAIAVPADERGESEE